MSATVIEFDDFLGMRPCAVGPRPEDNDAAEPPATEEPSVWAFLDARDLSEKLPPIPWLVEGLGLAPGPVSLFAGGGYSRKTMCLQSMALSVASGRVVWGLHRARRGKVVHIDYEQGRRLTQERYQRLARGMGFDLTELPDDALRLAVMPRQYLDGPGAEEALERAAEGTALAIVDSFRAAAPGADENSSDIRKILDIMSRVSERTGCLFIPIHHARKAGNDPSVTVDAKASIRGSGAMFDACQSVFVVTGKKNEPSKVSHEKDRILGRTVEDFGLQSEDVSNGEDARWGLRVVHLEGEQMGEQKKDYRSAIVSFLAAQPVRSFEGSVKAMRSVIGGNHSDLAQAMDVLVYEKRIARKGSYHRPIYELV